MQRNIKWYKLETVLPPTLQGQLEERFMEVTWKRPFIMPVLSGRAMTTDFRRLKTPPKSLCQNVTYAVCNYFWFSSNDIISNSGGCNNNLMLFDMLNMSFQQGICTSDAPSLELWESVHWTQYQTLSNDNEFLWNSMADLEHHGGIGCFLSYFGVRIYI